MAHGVQSAVNITTSGTWTNVFLIPSGKYLSGLLNINNVGSNSVEVDVAISSAVTPGTNEIVLTGMSLEPKQAFQLSSLVVQAGRYVLVRVTGTSPSVSAQLWGIEGTL